MTLIAAVNRLASSLIDCSALSISCLLFSTHWSKKQVGVDRQNHTRIYYPKNNMLLHKSSEHINLIKGIDRYVSEHIGKITDIDRQVCIHTDPETNRLFIVPTALNLLVK